MRPAEPKIYHIVHIDNLSSIISDGFIWSDATMVARGGPPTTIGMQSIKTARLLKQVDCHPGSFVGEYVPFNFCPRSVMLNLIWYANHPNLSYRGGQEPIVHLEASLARSMAWAKENNHVWAFTLSNARAHYVSFRWHLEDFDHLNWNAIAATDFRSADIKEAKQAEFLIHRSFPWHLVERIGVYSDSIVSQVSDSMLGATHRPRMEIKRDWYF